MYNTDVGARCVFPYYNTIVLFLSLLYVLIAAFLIVMAIIWQSKSGIAPSGNRLLIIIDKNIYISNVVDD